MLPGLRVVLKILIRISCMCVHIYIYTYIFMSWSLKMDPQEFHKAWTHLLKMYNTHELHKGWTRLQQPYTLETGSDWDFAGGFTLASDAVRASWVYVRVYCGLQGVNGVLHGP